MSSATVTKFKFFWSDQDVEQEQWLREMALRGLHLKRLNLPMIWTFVRGEPADMVYRLDFGIDKGKPEYRQLLQDAGWELAACLTGWQYWRTRAINGRSPELFTDSPSKQAKLKRLITLIVVSGIPSVILFASPRLRHGLSGMSWPFLAVVVGALALNLVTLLRLVARVLRMRRAQA